jgi:hypothetical protein
MPTPAAAPTPPSPPPPPPPRPPPARSPPPAAAAAAARGAGAQRALPRDRHLGWNGIEVEHLANERAQRDDELGDLDAAAGDHLVGRPGRQAHLLFGAEQDDVGKGRFDRVANAAPALGAGRVGRRLRGASRASPARRRITAASGRRAAVPARKSRRWRGSTARSPVKRAGCVLVGGDEGLQSSLICRVPGARGALHAVHYRQADADGHERHHDDPEQGRGRWPARS